MMMMTLRRRTGLVGGMLASLATAALGADFAPMAKHRTEGMKPVAADRPVGKLETVFEFDGPTVTGVAVSRDKRIFVSFPRWTDPLAYTAAEIRNGRLVPYPDAAMQDPSRPPGDRLISVQSVVASADGRLWLLDSACVNLGDVIPGGPKLVAVDLETNRVVRKILFPDSVALRQTYLNDVRFDLKLGRAGFAFITDSSTAAGGGLIVVDLATGESFRRLQGHRSVLPEPKFLPIAEGRPLMLSPRPGERKPFLIASDGIAVSADGDRVFYCPLSGRHLYSVDARVLADRSRSEADVEAAVVDEGDKGTGSDGLETDDRGTLYLTSYEHDAILRRSPAGDYSTLVHDPRILWPDSMAISPDGWLYFTVNQLERDARFHGGHDERQRPWVLFRVPIGAGPSLLAQPPR